MPPIVHTLWISNHLVDKIRAYGVETYPHECCGALLGHDREGLAVGSRENPAGDDSPRNRFSVTSEDVLAAEKAARGQNLDVIGWYHSHPDHPARPSEYDRDHAWPWYSYIIVSVHHGAPEDMTSWRLNDDRVEFSPEGIEIRHSAAV
jgi:proteasome lid subunit RPN8/RPN11